MSKKQIILTVDGIVIFPSRREIKNVLLIRRKNPPFKKFLALPGGIVEYGESTETAVIREIREETSLEVQIRRLSGVYSDPGRDPRGHFITIAYLCTPIGGKLMAGDDAQEVLTMEFTKENICQMSPQLAFDHEQILLDVLKEYNNINEF